jgi:hypothetical protein
VASMNKLSLLASIGITESQICNSFQCSTIKCFLYRAENCAVYSLIILMQVYLDHIATMIMAGILDNSGEYGPHSVRKITVDYLQI